MQLCKILEENDNMIPPLYDDLLWWVKFRSKVNGLLKLNVLVEKWVFKVIVNTVIVLTFINCLVDLYSENQVSDVLNYIAMTLFVIEVLVKILGFGPELYFNDKWNKLDFLLVLIGLILEIFP